MRRKVAAVIIVSLVAGLSLAACAANAGKQIESATLRGSIEYSSVAYSKTSVTDQVVRSSRDLGLEMLASEQGRSLVVSPASAIVALSMLGSGASGDLEQQLAKIIGVGGQERDGAVNQLVGALAKYEADPETVDPEKLPQTPVVHMANQVVIDDQLEPTQTFLDSLTQWYDVGILRTDLGSEKSRALLDDWVNYNTAGMIKESSVEPSEGLRMVLQNATLLAARWEAIFLPTDTVDGDFTLVDGSTTPTKLMNRLSPIIYAEVDGWKMVQLPYDDRLVARFVLPPLGTGLEQIDGELLNQLEADLAEQQVELTLPKLDIVTKLDLKPLLEELGLTAAFGANLEAFDHISPGKGLFVAEVTQQGRVMVDEEGTIAAAVTEIMVGDSAMIPVVAPKTFVADRPHLVILQDLETGWDLFQIAVYQPEVK